MDIQAAIERYAGGHAAMSDALQGAEAWELDVPEAPGEWTPRQIVHHLADSEPWVAMRIRRILQEDEPHYPGYDQARYFDALGIDRPIEGSLGLVGAACATTVEILRRLPESAFARKGVHAVYGPMSLAEILGYYQNHCYEHADQIRRARATAASQGPSAQVAVAAQAVIAPGARADADLAAAIERYAAGYDAIVASLDGITAAAMDVPEAPGEWSPRQVVHHLADSEMWSALRMRRLLTEDEPRIPGYDQEAYVTAFMYGERPIDASLAAFRHARATTADILRRLPETAFARGGIHEETGPITLGSMVRYYAKHAHDHADQIRRARAVARG
jgi:hypothetical protein